MIITPGRTDFAPLSLTYASSGDGWAARTAIRAIEILSGQLRLKCLY